MEAARSQFIGVEHLSDKQIELIRSAIERQAKQEPPRQATADDTVDRLLDRF